MKAFEKWAGPAFYYGKDPLNRPILEAKRKGWRAALEEVLKIIHEQKPEDVQEIIEKELES